jgi:lysophospholipase L1-like esterase
MGRLRHSGCTFFETSPGSPILRIACAALLVSLVSVTFGCNRLGLGNTDNPVAPSGPPAPGSTIVYSAIGASDAIGVGSSVPCVPFTDCPNGMGYVPVAVRQLKAQGFTVNLLNLGIPTAVIGHDFESLGQQYNRTIIGNFIDQEMPFALTNSTIVTVFAGVNDIITVVAALGAGAGGSDPSGYIDRQAKAFGADYATLVAGIRARAPKARIVALNVPNVAGLPYFTGAPLAERQAQQRLSVAFTTTVVNPLTSQGVTVVDAMCDARSYVPSNYSTDFHPNDAGYAYIAGEVVSAITSSSYPAPRSSCPPMTLVN